MKITHVFGFFSRTSGYIQIAKAVNWNKLKKSSNLIKARLFYIYFQGRGAQSVVPKKLGLLALNLIKSNFNMEILRKKVEMKEESYCCLEY